MSRRRLTLEQRQKIREEVKNGKSRYAIADEFGITPRSVYYFTDDLPKKYNKRTQVTKKLTKKMREMVSSGVTRVEVARELDISPTAVCKRTKDLPDLRGKSIKGYSLEMLSKITKDGYFIPKSAETGRARSSFLVLKQYMPVKAVHECKRTVYFLEGKGREAFKAFVLAGKKKIISYHKLCAIMPLFGIPKKEYKEAVFGNIPFRRKVFRKMDSKKRALGGAVSDFLGRNLLPNLLIN